MNPYRILVVDRDPAVHELLASRLAGPEWQLDHVHEGSEGLARFQSTPYQLLIGDFGLPGLNHPDMLARLRAMRPETNVLVVTSVRSAPGIIQAIRERAFAYFSKPLTAPALLELIRQAPDTLPWPDDIRVQSGQPEWLTLYARCQPGTADRLIQFRRELEGDLPPARRDDLTAAFRELLMNAIEHGGQYDPRKWVRVSVFRGARSLIYHIQDPGNGFSFEHIPHAAVSNPPDAPVHHLEVRAEQGVRPGGFGIMLTRNLVDELLYNEAGNEVLFVKYL